METVDSGSIRVLSEFATENGADDGRIAFRLGTLGDDFIIASQSHRANMKDANVIPSDEETDAEFEDLFDDDDFESEAERIAEKMEMRENTKKSYADSIRRGWWRGNILFEKSNLKAVNDALTAVLAGSLAESGERAFIIKQGRDHLAIGAISNWGHNMSAPEEKATLQNVRDVELDGIEISKNSLHINVSTAKKLNKEISRIIESGNF